MQSAPKTSSTPTKAYHAPKITRLGKVEQLTGQTTRATTTRATTRRVS